jgi:hypothetical protein
MKTASALFVVALVACSGDDGKQVQLQPDASVDGPPDAPPPHVIRVQNFGDAPLLVMYRDGNGPWQAPVGGDELHVTDTYELLAVCGDASFGYETAIERSTVAEVGGMTYMPCFQSTSVQGTIVSVHGTMTQPGSVAFGFGEAEGTTNNWSFDLDVETGTRDLVAIGAGRMQIRRDINVAGAMTLPNLDVMTGGAAQSQVALTLNNTDASDMVTGFYYLLTGNDFFSLPLSPTMLRLAPPTQLDVNDQQYLSIQADAEPAFRSVFGRYTGGSSVTFTLLPKLTGVTLDATGASWGTLPDNDSVELFYWAGLNYHHASATPGSLGSTTKLAIDTASVPGFKQEWQLGTVDARFFAARRFESGATLQTGFFQTSPFVQMSRVRRDVVNAQRLRRAMR